MSLTGLAAWWGAVIATLVLLWDIFKWLSAGLKLRVSVEPNQRTKNLGSLDRKTLLGVEVSNVGDRPTTIRTVRVRYFESWAKRILGRAYANYIVGAPGLTQALPYSLHPGSTWNGGVEQTEELEGAARDGIVVVELTHSWHPRALRRRVKFAARRRPKPPRSALSGAGRPDFGRFPVLPASGPLGLARRDLQCFAARRRTEPCLEVVEAL